MGVPERPESEAAPARGSEDAEEEAPKTASFIRSRSAESEAWLSPAKAASVSPKKQYMLASKKFVEGVLQDVKQTEAGEEEYSAVHWLTRQVQQAVHHRVFSMAMCLLVIANALYIGFETEMRQCRDDASFDAWYVAEVVFALCFMAEFALRFWADGMAFFQDSWNVFDSALVFASVADTLLLSALARGNTLDFLVALRFVRLARLARIFRLLRFFKELWFLVAGILTAGRTLAWAWLLMLFLIYIPAIFATRFFGKANSEDEFFSRKFGTVPRSMWTLFEIMSMEGWAEIARQVMQKEPYAWLFFVFFICTTAFALMHVVVAVIVHNTLLHSSHRQEDLSQQESRKEKIVCLKIMEVFVAADKDGDGEVTRDEFLASLERPDVLKLLHEVSIDVKRAENLFDILDYDESGSLDAGEFIEGVMAARGEAKAKDLLALQGDLWKAEFRTNECVKQFDQEVSQGSLKALRGTVSRFQDEIRQVRELAAPFLNEHDLKNLKRHDDGGGDSPAVKKVLTLH
eukprot:gnl/TRDRNA2_/TRDRNA2_47110_c0_seq1.p1 gnl/TRDRNA2_/TRDRNA2_47110_c0~~gnl/TRDRNA2_/TRDRNA2_47110_c0_seq1.p1  ORF type:complete len:550 (-),score=136.92 gnl/TRDRNA2_/TRDRNA2_47110_c0_seq1:61-1611(-)